MGLGIPIGLADRGVFERFRASVDPNWVAEALNATGKATLRRRRFPAERVPLAHAREEEHEVASAQAAWPR